MLTAAKDTEAPKLVMDVLEEFIIHKEQVLSIMTENDTKMLNTFEKLNKVVGVPDNNEFSFDSGDCVSLDKFMDLSHILLFIQYSWPFIMA